MRPSPRSRSPRPRSKPRKPALANAVLEHDRAKILFEKGALPRQRLDARADRASRRRRAARPGDGEPGAGQGGAAPRARSAAQRDRHLAGHRLRRRAQLRRGRDARRPADRRRRRPARDEARSRRLGARGRPPARRHEGGRSPCRPSPARPSTGQLAAIAPEVDERNRHFKIDVRVPERRPHAALGHVCHRAHRRSDGRRTRS